jgi:hypothetical protein
VSECKEKYDINIAKAYIIIYHQCSPNLKNDLNASDLFPSIRQNQDVIGLLCLIQGLCCSYDAKIQSVMATVASHKCLFTYYQKAGVNNHTYHCKFLAHVETIETYGGLGSVGVIPTFLKAKIIKMANDGTIKDAANPTNQEKALAITAVREEYLAALMLSRANRDRFNELRNDLQNQYGYGEDRYPKTTDACLSLLNRWKVTTTPSTQPRTPRTATPTKPNEDAALVFTQDATKSGGPKRNSPFKTVPSDDSSTRSAKTSPLKSPIKKPTNVWCKTCGALGHVSAVCPEAKPPAQVHAMTETDDPSVASDSSSIFILAQQTDRKPIDPDFLLLDSQSTVNLFSNPNLVNNIRQATTPINVHCNKGTMPTTAVTDFGTNEVYLNPDGIANVLSLFSLGQKHHITYDSKDCGGVFKVHTSEGLLEFKLTDKGLHALDLKTTPNAAHLLVTSSQPTDGHLHVNNVRLNYEGFTKKQILRANDARRLMQMVALPSERALQSMVRLNMLQNCPITNDDIKNANTIWGSDIATIRGKTIRRKPDRVETDYVEIPCALLSFQVNVTLVADVMFVNGVPFLVSASRNINLITIEHAPKHTASKLGYLLQRIVNVYARAGLRV